MKYNKLGNTNIEVSRLCFGALTIGPLQKNLSFVEGGKVIKAAIDKGVNFIDTAELYQNYGHIQNGCAGLEKEIILSSKSYAYTYEDMRKSIETACRETKRDYIDIFSLHEQSSRLTLKGHKDALTCLFDAKKDGLIRAIGVSTHFIEVVRAASMIDEVDVIHPIINKNGLGIADGTKEAMLEAIEFATYMGKGIYAMKALGGGHLAKDCQDALDWILALPNIASVAVGMHSLDEVAVNSAIFSSKQPDKMLIEKLQKYDRDIFVESYCEGCGKCAEKCSSRAISIINQQAIIDKKKCIRCGYCAAYCPHFCIKVV